MVAKLRNNRYAKFMLYCIFVFFPLREALAFGASETSFIRFGEILFVLSPILLFTIKCSRNNHYKISAYLFIFLIYSILFGCILGSIVNALYAFKFVVRCLLICTFLWICETGRIRLDKSFFSKLFKYIVVVEGVFCLIEICGFKVQAFVFQPYSSTLWGLPRLTGTASESGFMIPILTPCYYFFLCTIKKNKYWFAATFLMILLSTSSFGYAVLLFVPLFKSLNDGKNTAVVKILMYGAILCVFILITAQFIPQLNGVLEHVLDKVMAFGMSNEDDMDWSGAERLENRLAGFRGFAELPLFNESFGGGIGAAQYFSEKYVILHYTSEECGIAYLGLLLNLGIFGLGIMLFVIYKASKCRINNIYSNAIFVGFIVQALQFLIITNIWLYFFWFEIGLMILIKRNRKYLMERKRVRIKQQLKTISCEQQHTLKNGE